MHFKHHCFSQLCFKLVALWNNLDIRVRIKKTWQLCLCCPNIQTCILYTFVTDFHDSNVVSVHQFSTDTFIQNRSKTFLSFIIFLKNYMLAELFASKDKISYFLLHVTSLFHVHSQTSSH